MRYSVNDINENLIDLRKQIELACRSSGRDPKSVLLLAVSKKQSLDKLKVVACSKSLGHEHFGENYIQELVERQKHFPNLKWHLIGQLQSNKLKLIIGNVYLIHSMGCFKHLKQANKIAQQKSITQDILLQVDFSHETSKQGFTVDQLESAFYFFRRM